MRGKATTSYSASISACIPIRCVHQAFLLGDIYIRASSWFTFTGPVDGKRENTSATLLLIGRGDEKARGSSYWRNSEARSSRVVCLSSDVECISTVSLASLTNVQWSVFGSWYLLASHAVPLGPYYFNISRIRRSRQCGLCMSDWIFLDCSLVDSSILKFSWLGEQLGNWTRILDGYLAAKNG